MKTNFYLPAIFLLLTACTFNEELNEVSEYHEKEEQITIYSAETIGSRDATCPIPQSAFAELQFEIINETSNLNLTIKGMKICRIYTSGSYHFPTEYREGFWETDTLSSALTLETSTIELAPDLKTQLPSDQPLLLIPQHTSAWMPTVHPSSGDGSYILLNCQISYTSNEVFLSQTEIAIPLTLQLKSGQKDTIVLTLKDRCPWYYIDGTTPSILLKPITFDVSVRDWEKE